MIHYYELSNINYRLINFSDKLTSKFLLFGNMGRHKSLVGRDNTNSFPSSYGRNVFVANIPRSWWLRKEFYIRNIIDRIDYLFEWYNDILLFALFIDNKILNESILFEQFKNFHFEIGESNIIYRSFSRHICVLDPDEQIMNRSVNISHVQNITI